MSTATDPSRLLAWWQLLRGANVFTAASNVIAGFLIVQRSWEPADALAVLIAGSVALYLAGMVLNDVFDAELDAVERPERPIPAGLIQIRTASAVGAALLATGVALCWTAALLLEHPMAGLIGSLLAFAIVQYNRVLKATAVGPFAMGWCRVLNVLLGASVSRSLADEWVAMAYALGVGAYTVLLTRVAGSETIGALARRLRVRSVVSRMIQGFIVLDAVAATLAAGWIAGVAVLSMLIPTIILSRWASMT